MRLYLYKFYKELKDFYDEKLEKPEILLLVIAALFH